MEKNISYASSLPGRYIDIEGEGQFLYFSGTAYLGISRTPRFLQALTEGISRYGSHFGGSRRSNIQFAIIEEAEHELAKIAGVERALTLSSGSLAGQMVSHYFERKGRLLLAPGTHPALWTPANRPQTGDYENWVESLPAQMAAAGMPEALFLNSLDPLYARRYNLEWLGSFLDRYPDILIIIDDSHGWGVMGKGGRSAWEDIPERHFSRVMVVSSLGKAYGMPGGMVTGSAKVLQEIFDSPFFGGASPMSLAYYHAFLQCLDVFPKQLKTLQMRIDTLESEPLMSEIFSHIQGHPVFYTTQEGLAAYLHKHKILISSFSYPGPSDPLVNRVVVNSLHEQADLELLIAALKNWKMNQ